MKHIRLLGIIVCLVAVLALSSSALAAMKEPDASPAYTYASEVYAKLSVKSGVATAEGRVEPWNSSYKTSVNVELQKKDGSSWVKVASWSGTNSAGAASASGTKSVAKGYSYRVYITAKVYVSGVLKETIHKASSTVSY